MAPNVVTQAFLYQEMDRLIKTRHPATVRGYFTTLKACWNHSRRTCTLSDIFADLELPSDPQQKQAAYLTKDQVEFLLRQAADHPDLHLLLNMIIETGSRRGEIIQLTWDRVTFTDDGAIAVFGKEHRKNKREHTIYFSQGTATELKAHKQRTENEYPNAHPFIFLGSVEKLATEICILTKITRTQLSEIQVSAWSLETKVLQVPRNGHIVPVTLPGNLAGRLTDYIKMVQVDVDRKPIFLGPTPYEFGKLFRDVVWSIRLQRLCSLLAKELNTSRETVRKLSTKEVATKTLTKELRESITEYTTTRRGTNLFPRNFKPWKDNADLEMADTFPYIGMHAQSP